MIIDNGEIEILDYSFTKSEVFHLAKFLREHQEELPPELDILYKTLEDSIYNSLSIEEVKKFYS